MNIDSVTAKFARVTAASLTLALSLGAAEAAAQAYPAKPVRIVLTHPAGHPLDLAVRLIGNKLSGMWGQPVIVENKPGGLLFIATEYVVKSPPDGYTLLATTSQVATNPSLLKQIPYDTMRDLAPVTRFMTISNLLVVDGKLGVNSVKEWVALAKANPGKFNFASAGPSSTGHMINVGMNQTFGIDVVHTPYPGTAPLVQAILRGDAAIGASDLAPIKPYLESGRLKLIGSSGAKRSFYSPTVPTLQESGVPFTLDSYSAMFAPAGTPEPILNKVAQDVGKALAMQDIQDWYRNVGMETYTATPAEFREFFRKDVDAWAGLIKAAGIKMQ